MPKAIHAVNDVIITNAALLFTLIIVSFMLQVSVTIRYKAVNKIKNADA